MDDQVLKDLRLEDKIEKIENVELKSASDDVIECKGKITLAIELGKLIVDIPFLAVANLPFSALLSTHFLQRKGAVLDYGRHVLDYWQDGKYSGAVRMHLDVVRKESKNGNGVNCLRINAVTGNTAKRESSGKNAGMNVETRKSTESNAPLSSTSRAKGISPDVPDTSRVKSPDASPGVPDAPRISLG